ncbi:MAG: hypothetical protein ACM3X0_07430 [Bacteroidota bacterium]
MTTLKFLLIILLAGMGFNGNAWADRGHFGGHPGGHFHHHHGGIVLVAPLFYPWWYDGPAPVAPPQLYIEQGDAAGYWYYCADSRGFFPAVKDCPAGWIKIEPRP